MVITGGHSESKRVIPPQIQELANRIKPQLDERYGGGDDDDGDAGQGNSSNNFGGVVYEVLEYRQQVVAGMVYHFKIRFGEAVDDCLHVKVFQPLPHTGEGPTIMAHQRATLQDPLKIL
uniref:Cystatin domain-containing protein n=1 Tax=Pseudo-nitzschia australis TaxID=44445 RepID=A0A7S4AYD6_9STRA|mmetsp:Transcript_27619/g.60812  ORF Transcript_27619/g.60812 Transcript_27619/m.60812 type:complete len:119 (-) Transcript_27619:173-529(-)|eukprot:CAMPEP_0168188266 /NCGR_PEP_ID=MMETSP0139_2-20121125/15538_1 /TAXON_ID=44445 /ORGANISM="Pseudo-nitzschia australis, Strain 10249 10 AB" /LENGTH=118 /DNA_ID=CAMNT_0008110657 /DNA_START=60 /DNA_END=416 /DNA_ORIENTATION=-